MDENVSVREWSSALILFVLVFIFATFAYFSRDYSLPIYGENERVDSVQVIVYGAVESPGHYSFPRKTSIKKILNTVVLKENADLSKLKLSKKIIKNSTLTIPEKKTITIEVEYEGVTQRVKVLKGCYTFELIEKINLPPEADWKSLNSNKKLTRSKKIQVPKKLPLA